MESHIKLANDSIDKFIKDLQMNKFNDKINLYENNIFPIIQPLFKELVNTKAFPIYK